MAQTPPDVICPECRAANPAGSIHCANCGLRLISHGQATNVWSRPAVATPETAKDAADFANAPALSSQATMPIPAGDWNAGASRSAAPSEDTPTTWTPPRPAPPIGPRVPAVQKPGGPPGFVLGCFGLLIVLAVAGLFAWSVGRPYVRNRVGERVSSGVATEVGAIPEVTVTSSGEITLTDADLNRSISDYSGSIDPISDPVATIDRTGMHIRFKVYSRSSEFTGLPIVQGGRIVIRDSSISGLAGQVVDADEIASIVEQQLADLMTRSNLTPSSIVLSDGSLSVITAPAAGSGNSI